MNSDLREKIIDQFDLDVQNESTPLVLTATGTYETSEDPEAWRTFKTQIPHAEERTW